MFTTEKLYSYEELLEKASIPWNLFRDKMLELGLYQTTKSDEGEEHLEATDKAFKLGYARMIERYDYVNGENTRIISTRWTEKTIEHVMGEWYKDKFLPVTVRNIVMEKVKKLDRSLPLDSRLDTVKKELHDQIDEIVFGYDWEEWDVTRDERGPSWF